MSDHGQTDEAKNSKQAAQEAADEQAAMAICLCWVLVAYVVIGQAGSDAVYQAGGVAIGASVLFPALLAFFLKPYRGGIARTLLVLAATLVSALAAAGLSPVGAPRLLLANLLPATLALVAAHLLHHARHPEPLEAGHHQAVLSLAALRRVATGLHLPPRRKA